jgi:hypothetical protein
VLSLEVWRWCEAEFGLGLGFDLGVGSDSSLALPSGLAGIFWASVSWRRRKRAGSTGFLRQAPG